MEWTPAAEVDAHQEALRIQVAVVAAQQAALLAEEARLQQQQTALNQQQERQTLRQEREAVTQSRLRASGDVEFGKRQLQEEWDALRKAQQQWQCQREEQEAELTQRGRALRRGEEALADAERALGDDRYAW